MYTLAQSSNFHQAVSLSMGALCLRDIFACANEVSANKQAAFSLRVAAGQEQAIALRSVSASNNNSVFVNSVWSVSIDCTEFFCAFNKRIFRQTLQNQCSSALRSFLFNTRIRKVPILQWLNGLRRCDFFSQSSCCGHQAWCRMARK